MKIRFRTYFILKTCLLATTVLFLSGCVERGCTDPNASNYNPDAERNDESCVYDAITNEANQDFVETYADIVHAMYEDAYTEALNLQETIDLFLANPTIPGLEACKEKWVLAHIPIVKVKVSGSLMALLTTPITTLRSDLMHGTLMPLALIMSKDHQMRVLSMIP